MSKLTFGGIAFLFSLLLGTISTMAYAEKGGNPGHGGGWGNHGKGHGHQEGEGFNGPHGKSFGPANEKQGQKAKAKFSDNDRTVITNYFNNNPFPVTALPPGIAKNLALGKPLPPGIAKRFLPPDLAASLPNYPGYEYLVAGQDVLLVNTTTNVVADILKNFLQ